MAAPLLPELVTDVLRRLPVKTLLRLRCVSKSFCSEIDDSYFIKTHLNHSLNTNTNLGVILREPKLFIEGLDSPTTMAVELDDPLDNERLGSDIIGSSNGLLALIAVADHHSVALYNPSTRKYRRLPYEPIDFTADRIDGSCISFGFGHDPIDDDYKIVRIVQFYNDTFDDSNWYCEVNIYSLKTNSWRKIVDFPHYLKFLIWPGCRYERDYGVYASCALHWMAREEPWSNRPNSIVAFRLGVEKFDLIELPNLWSSNWGLSVGALDGCLCLFYRSGNYQYDNLQVEIWMMKEYWVKESWTKILSTSQLQLQPFDVRPLAYSTHQDTVLLQLDFKSFVWYDLKTRKGKNVKINSRLPHYFQGVLCVGSLVPLNGRGRVVGKEQQEQ